MRTGRARVREDLIARRGREARNIAKVAAGSRKMLEVVFYVVRDGQARCLTPEGHATRLHATPASRRNAWQPLAAVDLNIPTLGAGAI